MLKMRNLASSIAVAGKAGKWERFMVVTKAGRTREMLFNSYLSGNCLEYEMKIVNIRKAELIIRQANAFLEIS